MASPAAQPDPQLERRKSYTRWRRGAAQVRALTLIALPFAMVWSGFSEWLRDRAASDAPNFAVQIAMVGLATVILMAIVIVGGGGATYYVERRFGTSRQPVLRWLRDATKSAGVAGILVMAWFGATYGPIHWAGSWWWLWTALLLAAAFAIYVFVFPTIVLPFYYRVEALPEGTLRARIAELLARAEVRVGRIERWHLGARTIKANAVVCGFGRSRAVLVSDTLLEACSEDEVAALVAHEIGHTALSHIAKRTACLSLVILASVGVTALAVDARIVPWASDSYGLGDLANAPVLACAMGMLFLYGFALLLRLYRRQERQADAYGWKLAPELVPAFISALAKVDARNLLYFEKRQESKFTHPATAGRIEAARKFLEEVGSRQ